VLINTDVSLCIHDRLPLKEMCSGSHELFKFREITDYISEKVHNRDIVALELIEIYLHS